MLIRSIFPRSKMKINFKLMYLRNINISRSNNLYRCIPIRIRFFEIRYLAIRGKSKKFYRSNDYNRKFDGSFNVSHCNF